MGHLRKNYKRYLGILALAGAAYIGKDPQAAKAALEALLEAVTVESAVEPAAEGQK